MATSTEWEPTQSARSSQPDQPKRRRRSWIAGLVFLILVAGAGVLSLTQVSWLTASDARQNMLTYPVSRGALVITVTEEGNVESARNEDIKCRIAGGSTILWIVEDGKHVKQGDVIIKLDESKIEELLNVQKITYEKARALMIQVEEEFAAAKISVQEYLEGTYVKEHQLVESQIVIALENRRSSENMLTHTERMARKGYVTPLQRESQQFAVRRAELDLAAAETAKHVLETFTKTKMMKDLESKRDAAEAKMKSEQAACQLEQIRMKRLEEQFKNCVITAPQDGMVVFANENQGGRGGGQQTPTIEEGAIVREQQTMIRLPDLTNMQVKVKVHESKVDQIKRGMPARIRIQDRELNGTVESVANQPESGSWFSSNVKEYATIVKIDAATSGLKPGMTAEVEILVADLKDVLSVPVQAVVERAGKFSSWVQTPRGPEQRPVVLGLSNDKVIEIKDGLIENDAVVLNPLAVVAEARAGTASSDDASEEGPAGKSKDWMHKDAAPASSAGAPGGSPAPGGPAAAAGPGQPGAGNAERGPGREGGPGGEGRRRGGNMMQLDKDGDGKISREEAPAQMQTFFDRLDTNADGSIDAAEMAAAARNRPGAGGGGPPPAAE